MRGFDTGATGFVGSALDAWQNRPESNSPALTHPKHYLPQDSLTVFDEKGSRNLASTLKQVDLISL